MHEFGGKTMMPTAKALSANELLDEVVAQADYPEHEASALRDLASRAVDGLKELSSEIEAARLLEMHNRQRACFGLGPLDG